MREGDLPAAAEVLEREASERRVSYFRGRVGRQGWMALPAPTYLYLVVALRADVSPDPVG